ncbi:MAG: hypothetical protein CMB56_006350 [Methanobacteriota archaeon]|nr:MAG: hypothetical protein CMB56_006350 [Euryarchaeota archaeon]
MNNLIYVLSLVLILLSLHLTIRTLKRQKKKPVNIWDTSIPIQNQNWQGTISTIQPKAAPPPHMFIKEN